MEVWPSGIGLQEQVPNYHERHLSKALVVSVMEKASLEVSGVNQEGEHQ